MGTGKHIKKVLKVNNTTMGGPPPVPGRTTKTVKRVVTPAVPPSIKKKTTSAAPAVPSVKKKTTSVPPVVPSVKKKVASTAPPVVPSVKKKKVASGPPIVPSASKKKPSADSPTPKKKVPVAGPIVADCTYTIEADPSQEWKTVDRITKKRIAEHPPAEEPESKKRKYSDDQVDKLLKRVEELERIVQTDNLATMVRTAIEKQPFESELCIDQAFSDVVKGMKADPIEASGKYPNLITTIQTIMEEYLGDTILAMFEEDTIKEIIFTIIREYTAEVLAKKQRDAQYPS